MIIKIADILADKQTQVSTIAVAISLVATTLGGKADFATSGTMARVVFPDSEKGDWEDRQQTKAAFCELVSEML